MNTSVTFKNGLKMPLVGFGTWKIPKDQCETVVHNAIKTGYRTIDCACDYGNEKEVGQGLKAAMDAGDVKREDLFVTSKLWNTFHAKEHVRPALERTLADLGLEYLDLYLIHFPFSFKYVDFETRYPPEWAYDPDVSDEQILSNVPLSETWAALEECVEAGLIKSIGVANFPAQLLSDLLCYAKIAPAVNQFEHHPYLQSANLVKYCKYRGVAVTAYSSFGKISYQIYQDPEDYSKTPNLLENEVLKAIGDKYGKTQAQVILKWQIQQEIAIIPKSCNEGRMLQNSQLFDFTLDEDDIAKIGALESGLRFNNPGNFSFWN